LIVAEQDPSSEPMGMHTTTMQRRSIVSTPEDQHQVAANSPVPKRRRKVVRSNAFSAFYGTRGEARLQILLLGGLLTLLALYTFKGSGNPLNIMREHRYIPSTSMNKVGDKSLAYAALRQEYSDQHPDDIMRSKGRVMDLHKRAYTPIQQQVYDIFNCPEEPPMGYPYAWNILQVLEHWPPDDTKPRPEVYQGLCVFHYIHDFKKAMAYREAEVPFIVREDPSVHQTVERWNDDGYMDKLMGEVPHRCEFSPNNHFMYWVPPHIHRDIKPPPGMSLLRPKKKHFHNVETPSNWTQPTEMLRMKYKDWLKHANVSDDKLGPDMPHWYYRLIGCGEMGHGNCDKDSSEFLFDELPFFQPKSSLYIAEPTRQRGIHCRFGMKGVIAENHFDGSRNFIALLAGERRYILSHPDQCSKLALYPMEHPSARHSAIDWSDPDLEKFPEFSEAQVNEVVLQAGDVMYLPTNWFHYIISLELNMVRTNACHDHL
jgi:hypothetical protein